MFSTSVCHFFKSAKKSILKNLVTSRANSSSTGVITSAAANAPVIAPSVSASPPNEMALRIASSYDLDFSQQIKAAGTEF